MDNRATAFEDPTLHVAWVMYVKTNILMHDTPALAHYYVRQCQQKERVALTEYYRNLDQWFGFPDVMRKHREMIAGLLRCIRFTKVRIDSPIFPQEDRVLFAAAMRRELDELFDFVEWALERRTLTRLEGLVVQNLVEKGHNELDELQIA